MPAQHSIPEEPPRRTLIIVVAVVAAILIGGFFYLLLRTTVTSNQAPRLANAIRPGSPDFEKYQKLIPLDDPPDADESPRALGDIVMTLSTTARNFTGRTITGLEIKGTVVDHDGKPVKDNTVIVIPIKQVPELEPNKTMHVSVLLEGFTDTDDRANIKMEVTGFTLR